MYNDHELAGADGVTIRSAANDEWEAIDRLAQLDSAPPPPREEMIVAEVGGEIRAAVSVRDGYAIANPFEHSRELAELAQARAAQLRADAGIPARRRRAQSGWRTTGLRLARASSRRRTGVV